MSGLHVLDLPQLYTKPSAQALLETLALLTVVPPSWDRRAASAENKPLWGRAGHAESIEPEGVTRYLTSIISSGLQWIHDDEAKEAIYNQASARLSERSGRTAMGAMSRTFCIPTSTGSFDLSLHEPALTGDDLGLKTWAASYLLAKRLHTLDLLPPSAHGRLRVLELGSGTGLVGLAMAGLGADVLLTDLPSICPNLARNLRDNYPRIAQNNGSAHTAILNWKRPALCEPFLDGTDASQTFSRLEKFPLILAADSMYSPDHPRMLVDTIHEWLSGDDHAKVIVELPYREAYLSEIDEFRKRMVDIGLQIIHEGEEKGLDDWSLSGSCNPDDEDDAALVTCWWSCWSRRL